MARALLTLPGRPVVLVDANVFIYGLLIKFEHDLLTKDSLIAAASFERNV
jgi:hypothetical protein